MALLRRLAVSFLCMVVAGSALAANITYQLTSLGTNSWRYDYALTNNGLSPIFEFAVFFDYASFSSLALGPTPAAWDAIIVQPDVSLLSDGFLDSLSMASGLAPGDTLSGLSVTFISTGATPGTQWFTVVDPNTFETLESGMTTAAMTTPVPEPSSLVLLAAGLAALISTLRSRSGVGGA